MRSLVGCSEFGKGQDFTVVSQRVLLQLADGHRSEGAGQALVCVLLTWKNIEDHEALDFLHQHRSIIHTRLAKTCKWF